MIDSLVAIGMYTLSVPIGPTTVSLPHKIVYDYHGCNPNLESVPTIR